MLRSFPIEDRAGLPSRKAHQFGVDDSFDVLELRPHRALAASAALPAILTHLPEPAASPTHTARSFDLQWHMINSQRMDMDRVDFCSTVDTDEIWTVRNVDDWPHNFHVHDTQFRILDIDGNHPRRALGLQGHRVHPSGTTVSARASVLGIHRPDQPVHVPLPPRDARGSGDDGPVPRPRTRRRAGAEADGDARSRHALIPVDRQLNSVGRSGLLHQVRDVGLHRGHA